MGIISVFTTKDTKEFHKGTRRFFWLLRRGAVLFHAEAQRRCFVSRRDAEAQRFCFMALQMPGLRYILVTDEDEK